MAGEVSLCITSGKGAIPPRFEGHCNTDTSLKWASQLTCAKLQCDDGFNVKL